MIAAPLGSLPSGWPGRLERRGALRRLGGRHHGDYLEAHQVTPPFGPDVEQARVAGLPSWKQRLIPPSSTTQLSMYLSPSGSIRPRVAARW
jgi:hypothetical protein